MVKQKWFVGSVVLASLILTLLPLSVAADNTSSSSTNYQLQDTSFGAGGVVNACSSSYCASQSAGSLTVGKASSTNFQLHAGNETTNQPYLYFTVNGSSTNLGVLSASSTATSTGTFSVRTYQAGGYVVQTVSQPPSNSEGHTLHTATGSCTSSPPVGTEFFGMNLVANTYPSSFGSNPVLNPVAGAAVGAAATGYNTANCFKYNVGDTIAGSTSPGDTTGEADYTVSYVFNIASTTQAGLYSFNDVLVATATY